jgi:hypothetical protein
MSSDTTAQLSQQPESPTVDAAQVVDEVIEHVEPQASPDENRRAAEEADRKETEVLKNLFAKNGTKVKEPEFPEIPGEDDDIEDEAAAQPEAKSAGKSKPDAAPKPEANSEQEVSNRLAFARAKWSPDEIEHYIKTFGNERYEKKAAEFRKMQADADRAFAIAKGINPSHLASPSRGAEAPPADSASRTNAGTPAASSLDAAAIDKLLSEAFDEDAATKIRETLNVSRQQAEQAAQARLELAHTLVNQRFESAQSALSAKYPGITDDNAVPKLRDMMGKLDPDGQSLSDQTAFNALVESAYYAVFGAKIAADQRASLIADNRKVRAGQISAGQRSGTPNLNTADPEAAILSALKRHQSDPARANREVVKLRSQFGMGG